MRGNLIFYAILLLLLIIVFNYLVYKELPHKEETQILNSVLQDVSIVKEIDMGTGNFDDLNFLEEVLANKKIILLGEELHTDSETLKAKARLIRFLHERLGYNVILYESGLYDSWTMNNEMNINPVEYSSKALGGIGLFSYWWNNMESETLLDYYVQSKQTTNPINIGGFDIQFSGVNLNPEKRLGLLKDFLWKKNINFNKYPTLKTNILQLIKIASGGYFKMTSEEQKKSLNELLLLSEEIQRLKFSTDTFIYSIYIKNFHDNLYKIFNYKTGSLTSMDFRDSLMANNLFNLIDNEYKDDKIIIWCANIHAFGKRYSEKYKPFGTYIKERYGTASYHIAFASYATLNNDKNIVNRKGKNSLESLLNLINEPYLFINLRKVESKSYLGGKFYLSANQGIKEKRKWKDIFDGIFFIKINKQSTF